MDAEVESPTPVEEVPEVVEVVEIVEDVVEVVEGEKKREREPPVKALPPNKDAHEKALKKYDTELADFQKQIEEINAIVLKKNATCNGYREKLKQHDAKLTVLQAKRTSAVDESKQAKQGVQRHELEKAEKKNKILQLQKQLKYRSIEDIDKAIKDIESDIAHNSHSLQAERKLVSDMQALNAQKPLVREYIALVGPQVAEDIKTLRAKAEEKGQEVQSIKAEVDKIYADIKAIRAQLQTEKHEADVLVLKRKEVLDKRREVDRARFQLVKTFERQQRAAERWSKYQRYLRAMEKKAAWEARQAEFERERMEREAEEALRDPYEKEMLMIDDLERYLHRIAPQTAAPKEEKAAEQTPAAVSDRTKAFDQANKVGTVTKLVSKKGQEASAIFAVPAKYSKAAATAAAAKPEVKKVEKPKHLRHVPDVFEQFRHLEIAPPLLSSDVPAALESLAKKREHYISLPRENIVEIPEDPVVEEEAEEVAPEPAAVEELPVVNTDDVEVQAEAQAETETETEAVPVPAAPAADDEAAETSAPEPVVDDEAAERERAAAAEQAKALAEEERQRRVAERQAEQDAVEQEEQVERSQRRRMSVQMAEEERARRIAELEAKKAEVQAETPSEPVPVPAAAAEATEAPATETTA